MNSIERRQDESLCGSRQGLVYIASTRQLQSRRGRGEKKKKKGKEGLLDGSFL